MTAATNLALDFYWEQIASLVNCQNTVRKQMSAFFFIFILDDPI